MTQSTSKSKDKINFYDDAKHDYREFWLGRDYEHLSEEVAIKKLLKNQHFSSIMDYGGGYGRLSDVLLPHADTYILVDPSQQQLDIGKKKHGDAKNVAYVLLNKKDYVPAKDETINLLVMVRVTHHILDLDKTLTEIYRVLAPGGKAIIEVANYAHFVNRIKRYSKLKGIPKKPTHVGHVANGIEEDTPFVNHNAKTVAKELNAHNLKVEKVLSVSNLRSGTLKKSVSIKQLVRIEKNLQSVLAPAYFGPSIFFLVQKV